MGGNELGRQGDGEERRALKIHFKERGLYIHSIVKVVSDVPSQSDKVKRDSWLTSMSSEKGNLSSRKFSKSCTL